MRACPKNVHHPWTLALCRSLRAGGEVAVADRRERNGDHIQGIEATEVDNSIRDTIDAIFCDKDGAERFLALRAEMVTNIIGKLDASKQGHDEADAPRMMRYGFDYKVHCHCAALLDKLPLLHYFQGDGIMLDQRMPKANWPALIVGPEGSTSALHVDSAIASPASFMMPLAASQ